jgi:ABC-type nitrate/sulfonate/bicarbonate transport system permease component
VNLLKRFPPALVSMAVILLVWQAASGLDSLTNTLPSVGSTFNALWTALGTVELWQAIGLTLLQAFVGLIIGLALAIPTGLLLGLSKFGYFSSQFTLNFLRVIPPIVIIPILLLVLGPTMQMAFFIVGWPVFFIMTMQTAYGVRDTDPVLLETMKCYRQSTFRQIVYARIPSAAPFMALGLRICVVVAVLGSTVAGLIGGAPGLGQTLYFAESQGMVPETFALVVLLGIIGLSVSRIVERVHPKIVFWVRAS